MEQVQAICFFTVLSLFTSCGTQREMETFGRMDSTRIEIRTHVIRIPDTVYFEIPQQHAERTTVDSASRLENEYAVSDTRINADGSLFHSLQTKPQRKPVPTQREIERKDSIVYVDKRVEVPYPVERKLTWWENTSIKWFGYSLGLILILLIWTFRKPLLALARRFI